jgi:hypothetical protein
VNFSITFGLVVEGVDTVETVLVDVVAVVGVDTVVAVLVAVVGVATVVGETATELDAGLDTEVGVLGVSDVVTELILGIILLGCVGVTVLGIVNDDVTTGVAGVEVTVAIDAVRSVVIPPGALPVEGGVDI